MLFHLVGHGKENIAQNLDGSVVLKETHTCNIIVVSHPSIHFFYHPLLITVCTTLGLVKTQIQQIYIYMLDIIKQMMLISVTIFDVI